MPRPREPQSSQGSGDASRTGRYPQTIGSLISGLSDGAIAAESARMRPLFADDAWRADALRRTVKDAGRDDRIHFVGYRRDVPVVMRGLDVLVTGF